MNIRWPGKYFISHSYEDVSIVADLKNNLPFWMVPVIFPPRKVNRDQVVSNTLMSTIRKCQGLIYLRGGASDSSFWVAMERDYALRLKKRVYSFNSVPEKLSRVKLPPLDLRVFHAFSKPDSQDVSEVTNFMRERHFQTAGDVKDFFDTAINSFENMVTKAMQSVKAVGAYVIVYWSGEVESSNWMRFEFDLAMREYPDRVLVVQLYDTPLPKWIVDRIKIDNIVKLMENQDFSRRQKIDDLIVRIYWLIYKNTQLGFEYSDNN